VITGLKETESAKKERVNHESRCGGETALSRMGVSKIAAIHAGVSTQAAPVKALKEVDSPKEESRKPVSKLPGRG
jgi:hypothetical protein